MPQRDEDWIVSDESWKRSLAPSWDNLPIDSVAVASLTVPKSVAVGAGVASEARIAIAALEGADEWVCERIIGTFHYQLLVGSTLTTWGSILDLRFEVLDSEPGTGVPVVPLPVDLTDPLWANRSFMGHYSRVMYQDSTWTDIAVHQAPYSGHFDIDIRVKRKVMSTQVIGMIVAWSSNDGIAVVSPRIQYVPRLRLYGSSK